MLEEGLAIARELGLKPLIERILAQREILRAYRKQGDECGTS